MRQITSIKSLSAILFLSLVLTFASCDKSSDPDVESREVTYEITGSYTGEVMVLYTNETGQTQTINNVSLPWTKKIKVANNVPAVTFTAATNSSKPDQAGKIATAKLHIGTEVKESVNQTADKNGFFQFGALSFTY
ncbi:MmpS family transport accessory protein [Cytophagaceae bacterium DM2B3-1]|uniref:MmpS family transport accessory protein n=1 Tax=Xanthocytophaga flava TaxID=3048013 RepID=A0ABT7CV32_9BACT|nr:MmpS family transport accessory protein [Xanthocytophaga flavus]MDJ1497612.1 MmpS family transport accessory protein [Xanthocytophaga flavus]